MRQLFKATSSGLQPQAGEVADQPGDRGQGRGLSGYTAIVAAHPEEGSTATVRCGARQTAGSTNQQPTDDGDEGDSNPDPLQAVAARMLGKLPPLDLAAVRSNAELVVPFQVASLFSGSEVQEPAPQFHLCALRAASCTGSRLLLRLLL
jgi:hypothetical protein